MPERVQFLCHLTPTRPAMLVEGPDERESRIIGEHFEHLARHTRDGAVVLAGRTTDAREDGLGIVILETEDASSARAIVEQDPAVLGGVMHAELRPYRIALLRKA